MNLCSLIKVVLKTEELGELFFPLLFPLSFFSAPISHRCKYSYGSWIRWSIGFSKHCEMDYRLARWAPTCFW